MLRRSMLLFGCSALLVAAVFSAVPRPSPDPGGGDGAQIYSSEQLDALLASIALYPDELLTPTLMASTYPLQVVEAYRWVDDPANRALQGDALVAALADKTWDPSVKSLVPFPQVLAMLNSNLDWMQQLGYAMTEQEGDVRALVQRLRSQAAAAGNLRSNAQQLVSTEDQAIVIAPAQPTVVYVPTYDPAYIYGDWGYPAYPPVYVPYPPGYALATGIAIGLAFGAAVAINRSLWGWATPYWGRRGVRINVNRYNSINVNRPPVNNPNWRPGGPGSGYRPGPGGRPRPPGGPVGSPGRPPNQPGYRPPQRPTNPPGQRPTNPPTQRPGPPGQRPTNPPTQRPGPPPQQPVTRPTPTPTTPPPRPGASAPGYRGPANPPTQRPGAPGQRPTTPPTQQPAQPVNRPAPTPTPPSTPRPSPGPANGAGRPGGATPPAPTPKPGSSAPGYRGPSWKERGLLARFGLGLLEDHAVWRDGEGFHEPDTQLGRSGLGPGLGEATWPGRRRRRRSADLARARWREQ